LQIGSRSYFAAAQATRLMILRQVDLRDLTNGRFEQAGLDVLSVSVVSAFRLFHFHAPYDLGFSPGYIART